MIFVVRHSHHSPLVSLLWVVLDDFLSTKQTLFLSIHFRKPVNVTSTNTTSNSPQKRSHWNELLQHPSHGKGLMSSNVATLLPTSRTSSLRRSKIQSLYAHRYSPNSTLEKSLYGEIDSHGRYRSPSQDPLWLWNPNFEPFSSIQSHLRKLV